MKRGREEGGNERLYHGGLRNGGISVMTSLLGGGRMQKRRGEGGRQ